MNSKGTKDVKEQHTCIANVTYSQTNIFRKVILNSERLLEYMNKQLTCIQLVSLKLPDFITDQWCYRRNQSTVNKK